jgi:hypothetical protein
MGLADQKYSVQAINSREQVIWFDDLGCLVEYEKGPDWKRWKGDEDVRVWIGHCETGEWIDATKAYYRYGDRTPMGYGYGALSEHVEGSFDYQTTVQRIDDGFTMREDFLKEKKMLHNK